MMNSDYHDVVRL